MKKRLVWIILIIIASLILDWLMQLSFYFYTINQNPLAFQGQKTLLEYLTGVIGDGVIAPIINVLVFVFFTTIHLKPQKKTIVKMFILALITDILVHFFQGAFSLTNWSMPKPFAWNFAGYWHMISLPIQMTYLYYFFYTMVVKWKEVKKNVVLKRSITAVFGLMLLFVVLFFFDNGLI